MDFWLPVLGGAVGAAIINGILALYKLKKDKTDEHWQWLRNQRLDAYVAFLESCDNVQRSFHDYKHERKSPEDIYVLIEQMSVQRLQLLASKKTVDKFEKVGDALMGLGEVFDPIPADLAKLPAAEKSYTAAITALRAAMNEDLELDKPRKSL